MNYEILPTIVILSVLVIAVALLISSSIRDRRKKNIPQRSAVRLPFPQHVSYAPNSIKPDHVSQADLDAAVIACYQAWKSAFVLADAEAGRAYLRTGLKRHFLRYRILASAEGQASAMLICTLMAGFDADAQGWFDKLYAFCRAHPSTRDPDLMSWQVIANAFPYHALESSTNADMLIAYALLMADRQWGSDGLVNYKACALRIIEAIKSKCLHPKSKHLLLGSWVAENQPDSYNSTRSADTMPAVLAAFYHASQDKTWKLVSQRMLSLLKESIAKNGPQTGLAPEIIFVADNHAGEEHIDQTDKSPEDSFGVESCRLLQHLGLAFLFTADEPLQTILKPVNAWIVNACAGDPEQIKARYSLKGEALTDESDLALTAAFCVAAMCTPKNQAWLNKLWDNISSRESDPRDSYGSTLKLLALLAISANWWPSTSH